MNRRQCRPQWSQLRLGLAALALSTVLLWMASNARLDQVIAAMGTSNDMPDSSNRQSVSLSVNVFLPAIFGSPPEVIPAVPPLPPLEWDPRLGPGGWPYLDIVKLTPATVAGSQKFWRIVKVQFQDSIEAGIDHSIYLKLVDGNWNRVSGKKAHLTSLGGISGYPDEKPLGDPCDCNFSYLMYGDAYAFNIEDVYPSDMISGMIMPMRRHVNYRITFQFSVSP